LVIRKLLFGFAVLLTLTIAVQAQPDNKFSLFSPPVSGGEINGDNIQAQLNWERTRAASNLSEKKENKPLTGRQQPFFKSLLVPGWGQLSKGKRFKAYAFFAVEATLVTSLITFQTYKGWLEEDYETFACQHAGVTGGKDHQFYVDIGNWQDNTDFNEQRLRDRQFDRLYTNPADSWNWDAEENRLHFKSLRIDADRAGQKSLMVLGVLILNHLFSAVDASGKSDSKSGKITVESRQDGQVSVGLNYRF